jgi:hypothetical protein
MNKKTIAAGAATLLCAAGLGYGQFVSAGPIAVFDIDVFIKVGKELEQALQTYDLLVRTYETTQNTFLVLRNAAQMITGKYGWQYVVAPLTYPTSANAFGSSGGWMSSLNNGLATTIGYELAAMRYSNPYAIYNFLSAQGQSDFAAHHATIELSEGTSQQTMAITGGVRARVLAQNSALNTLESSALADDPANNTEVGVLNTISGAALASAKTAQDTNNLLAAIADIQTVEMKRRRDELVQAINDAGAFQAATQPTIDGLWSGDGAAHNARLP